MSSATSLRRARLASVIAAQVGASALARSDQDALVVTGISVYPVREPESSRRYTVLKLQTKSGLAGYGECDGLSTEDFALAKKILIGVDPTAQELVRQRLKSRPGVQAAANIALFDLVGKHVQAPLYQVLGGPTRNKARALTTLQGASDEALFASLEKARAGGYRAFVVTLPATKATNHGQDFVNTVRQRLDTLRKKAGDGVDFVLAGRGGLSSGDASSVAKALERFHLLWFDQPCQLSNLAAVRKIAGETVTPLGFGSEVDQAGTFQELLREQVVDVLRPKITSSGISSIRKMAALAEIYYVAVAPHHEGGPIGTAAALHLAASLPNFFIQHIPWSTDKDRALRRELTQVTVEAVKDGFAELPTGSGLGIDVSESALEKYKERTA